MGWDDIFGNSLQVPLEWSTIVLLLAFVIVSSVFLVGTSNLPPGPLKLPLIGNAWWVVKERRKQKLNPKLTELVADVKDQYGDVFHLRIGSSIDVIFLNSYDAINEAFVKRSEDFSARPSWLIKQVRKGQGIIFYSGDQVKALRKFSLKALRDFGVGKSSLEERVMTEIDATCDLLKKAEGDPVDSRLELLSTEINDVIRNLNSLAGESSVVNLYNLLPQFVRRAFGFTKRSGCVEDQIAAWKWVYAFFNTQIQEHRSSFDENNIRDFTDLFIQKENEGVENDLYTEETLYNTILDLFTAGGETTGSTLNWCLLYLQEYPDVQRKCQDEIQEKCGARTIQWSDRNLLPFTVATLMEVQRHANTTASSIPHTNSREVMLHGYRIPANALILANLYAVHMDPKHWNDPRAFRPERHLKDGKLIKNQSFIPFSIGPRMCLGDTLARMELFLVVTNLLQKFSFHPEDERVKHSLECNPYVVVRAPYPYNTRPVYRG